jgi:hypothetical protein
MTPSRSLKSSPPRFIATPGELPFQEGRPLPPSDDEDEGQLVQSAKHFAPNQEVLMIHADQDCDSLERVQLGDYDDYLLDPLDEDVDATMDSVSPASIKAEDADDIQKERRRLVNAKRTQCRHHAVETNQQGSGNLHDYSTGDLHAIQRWQGCPQCHHCQAARVQRRGSLQLHPLSTPSRLPGDNSKAQARSWGTIHSQKEDSQFEGTIQGSSPRAMPMAPEEQAFRV